MDIVLRFPGPALASKITGIPGRCAYGEFDSSMELVTGLRRGDGRTGDVRGGDRPIAEVPSCSRKI